MKKVKTAVYVIVILLLAVNIYMSVRIRNDLTQIQKTAESTKSLPCESVPLNWAVKNYNCANSLLRAMNVTNVKFNPPGTLETQRHNLSTQHNK